MTSLALVFLGVSCHRMINSWAVVDAFGLQQVLPVQLRERYPSFRTLQMIQTSLSSTIDNINILYPQSEAALRNAASRKDGYWPFIAKNEAPPQDFTYGEFPLDFFESLLTLAVASCTSCPDGVRSNAELIDLGSGSGRLVMTAASSSNRWRKVRGIEILPSLHELALDKLRDAYTMDFLSAEVQFENCDWSSHDLNLSTADVVFSYTTALRSSGSVLAALTEAIRLKLRPGCVVITTDYELGDGFTLVASADGRNEGAGGECTGYIFIKD